MELLDGNVGHLIWMWVFAGLLKIANLDPFHNSNALNDLLEFGNNWKDIHLNSEIVELANFFLNSIKINLLENS